MSGARSPKIRGEKLPLEPTSDFLAVMMGGLLLLFTDLNHILLHADLHQDMLKDTRAEILKHVNRDRSLIDLLHMRQTSESWMARPFTRGDAIRVAAQAGAGQGGEELVGGHDHGGQEDQLVLRQWQPLHNNSSRILPPQDGQTSQIKYNSESMEHGAWRAWGSKFSLDVRGMFYTMLVTEKGARKYSVVYIVLKI